jgi:hypothetical protein
MKTSVSGASGRRAARALAKQSPCDVSTSPARIAAKALGGSIGETIVAAIPRSTARRFDLLIMTRRLYARRLVMGNDDRGVPCRCSCPPSCSLRDIRLNRAGV